MTDFYLSKSGYCRALRCPKMLWLDRRKPEAKAETANTAALENAHKVGEAARSRFGEYALVEYAENKQTMLDETRRLITKGVKIICEASFAHNGRFCAVDILRQCSGGHEIIEVKSAAAPKDIYLDDIAFQYHVLKNCGLDIKKATLMHINSGYTRLGRLDLQQLFTLRDCTQTAIEKQGETAANIDRFAAIAAAPTEPESPYTKDCRNCEYNAYCQPAAPQTSGGKQQSPPRIDREAIRQFLSTLRWPLYYLDFETFRDAIPMLDNTRPYQQIPFQYSLHIQSAPGAECEHREFLAEAGTDPRRAIAGRLCADIPKDACVLAYYMSFEKGRIQELAETFPDLRNHLMAVHANIKDLIIPFKSGAWQQEAMHGSASIKAVLPALFPDDSELDYAALDLIHNGGEAMDIFPGLPRKPPEEQNRIRAALLAYCRLDTLAMVKILEKLQNTVESEE